jgi:hypothetical protein
MLDIYDEFLHLVEGLNERSIEYALCGGMALAVHGSPRATIDIDLLVLPESVDEVFSLAHDLDYKIRGKDLSFAGGAIEIRRISKIDSESGDLLSLDLLLVTPQIEGIWSARIRTVWENHRLSVVSRDGLIALKTLRGSGQDFDDIQKLRNPEPSK